VDAELLGSVFCDLVESAALLGGEPVGRDEVDREELGGLCLSVRFSGDRRGWLAWHMGRGTCERIAGNVLGQEVDDAFSRNRARETLKDLTRDLCTQVLGAAYGDTLAIQLSETGLERSTAQDWQELLAEGGLCFRIEGEPVVIQFREEDAPCR
jgi:hypothetical protein